jgi:hypothetical protein
MFTKGSRPAQAHTYNLQPHAAGEIFVLMGNRN